MRNLTFQIGSGFEAVQQQDAAFHRSLELIRGARPAPLAALNKLNRKCTFKDRIAVVSGASYAA